MCCTTFQIHIIFFVASALLLVLLWLFSNTKLALTQVSGNLDWQVSELNGLGTYFLKTWKDLLRSRILKCLHSISLRKLLEKKRRFDWQLSSTSVRSRYTVCWTWSPDRTSYTIPDSYNSAFDKYRKRTTRNWKFNSSATWKEKKSFQLYSRSENSDKKILYYWSLLGKVKLSTKTFSSCP